MKKPSETEQRAIVRQQAETGRILDRMRREALRGMPYDEADVDAVLSLGDHYDGPPRFAEGMVEMQRLFMKHPLAVRNRGGTGDD